MSTTDCHFSPTGKAFMDDEGRCTCEPVPADKPPTEPIGTLYIPACTMCCDTHECPECNPDAPDEECTMCFGRGDCPECGDGSDD